MDLLLILTYTAICYAVFKIFKIPINKWTVPTAVLGGVVLIGSLILLMSYNHPFTSHALIYFRSAPVVPAVQGIVTEVPVVTNTPLKKGEVLFKLDARPYQASVDSRRAALAEAEQNAKQLKSAYDAAAASAAQAAAERNRSKQAFDRVDEANRNAAAGGRPGPIAVVEVENRRGVYLGAEAAYASALFRAEQAKLAFEAEVGGVNPLVARLKADLDKAEYELSETVVRAPGNGYVTQVFLRPGMMAAALPLRPVMVFIHEDDRFLGAAFVQNSLQRVKIGDEAEVAFKAIPGRVFKARVSLVIDVMAQGQLQPTGALIDPASPERLAPGRAIAGIEVLDDLTPYNLPGGAMAEVAIYTEHFHHVAVMRKILLRMSSWLNYVFLEH